MPFFQSSIHWLMEENSFVSCLILVDVVEFLAEKCQLCPKFLISVFVTAFYSTWILPAAKLKILKKYIWSRILDLAFNSILKTLIFTANFLKRIKLIFKFILALSWVKSVPSKYLSWNSCYFPHFKSRISLMLTLAWKLTEELLFLDSGYSWSFKNLLDLHSCLDQ